MRTSSPSCPDEHVIFLALKNLTKTYKMALYNIFHVRLCVVSILTAEGRIEGGLEDSELGTLTKFVSVLKKPPLSSDLI